MENEIYDIVIVGGGISGLYFLYKILKLKPDWKILLLEKEDRLGGRIWTVYDDEGSPLYERGARRIMHNHYRMINLIKELGLELIDKNVDYFTDENKENQKFAKIDKETGHSIIKTGYSSVIEKLSQKIGHTYIKLSCSVNNISFHNNLYHIKTPNFDISSIITVCSIPVENYKDNWDIYNKCLYLINSIESLPITKINAFDKKTVRYQNSDEFYLIIENGNLIQSSLYENKWIIPVYNKNESANYWFNLFNKGKELCRKKICDHVKNYIGPVDIPEYDLQYWKHAYHNWISENLYLKHSHQLIPLNNLCIIGEGFGPNSIDNASYSERALIVADKVLCFFKNYLNQINVLYLNNINLIFDQENTGSCTSNALSVILMYLQSLYKFPLSRLYIYYNTRLLMGTTNFDTGSDIFKAVKAIELYGVCPEYLWPLKDENVLIEPPSICYEYAKKFPVEITHTSFKISDGDPFSKMTIYLLNNILLLCSINIQNKNYIQDNGFLSLINPDLEFSIHDILIIGIDNINKKIICFNSYGLKSSIFYLSFDQIKSLNPINDDIFAITGSFKNNYIDLENYKAIEEFTNKEQLNVHQLCSHFFDIRVEYKREFDHIIIGNTLTSYYLAYRLQKLYPNDSILLLNEGNDLEMDYFYFENSNVLQNLLDELNINVKMPKRDSQKVVDYLNEFFDVSISCLLDLFMNERFSKLYKNSVNRKIIDKLDLDSSIKLSETCPLYYYICSLFINYSDSIQNIINLIVIELTRNFSSFLLGEFLELNLYKYLILKNVECKSISKLNKKVEIQLKSKNNLQVSSGIEIKYKKLYRCTYDSEADKRLLIPIFTTNFYLHTKTPILSFEPFYNENWGLVTIENEKTIHCKCVDKIFYNQIENLVTVPIYPNFKYNLEIFQDLKNFLTKRLPIKNFIINEFEITRYENLKYQMLVSSTEKKSFYDIMFEQFQYNSSVHYLNSNYSHNPFCAEGSIIMIDLFLKKHYK